MKILKKAVSIAICATMLLQVYGIAGSMQVSAELNYSAEIKNGDFEAPQTNSLTNFLSENTEGICWKTTASDKKIELVRPSMDLKTSVSEYNTAAVPSGEQFAELDANEISTLYQDILSCEGESLYWGLNHRGRKGTDTMAVVISEAQKDYTTSKNSYSIDGYSLAVKWLYKNIQNVLPDEENIYTIYSKKFDLNMTENNSKNYFSLEKTDKKSIELKICLIADNNDSWSRHYGKYVVPDNTADNTINSKIIRLAFVSVYSASTRNSVGNMIDDVTFSAELPKEPTPSPVFDEENSLITNLNSNSEYIFIHEGTEKVIKTDENGNVPVEEEWKNDKIDVVKPGQNFDEFSTLDSDPANVDIVYNYSVKIVYADDSEKTDGANFSIDNNGQITDKLTSYAKAKEGDTVTVKLPYGYLGDIKAEKLSGTTVHLSNKSFKMPADDVIITVKLYDEKVMGSFKYFTEYSFSEPWGLNLYTYGNGATPTNTSAYILKSKDVIPQITSDYVMEYGSKYVCEKPRNLAGKDLVGCFYYNDIYTYELEYHIYVVFTVTDENGVVTYSKVKDRQMSEFMETTIEKNASNVYAETKPAQATQLCKSIMDFYDTVIQTISAQGAIEPGFLPNGREVRYSSLKDVTSISTDNSLFSGAKQNLRVIEPWGLELSCKADVTNAEDYGVIAFNCKYNNLTTTNYNRNNIPSVEYLLGRKDTNVFSYKNGNVDYQNGEIKATFTDEVFICTLDSDVIFAFFVRYADGTIVFNTPKYVNIYDLTVSASQTSDDAPLFKAMIDLYKKELEYHG